MPPHVNAHSYPARVRAWADGLAPDPDETVSEWADNNRVLSSAESPTQGSWMTDRNPPMREIMDCLGVKSPVTEVALMCCIQWGKTEIANNVLGYFIDRSPGPIMMVQPTIKMAQRWSRQRFSKMIAGTPSLSEKIPAARSRDSGNTTLSKEFSGGMIVITGANSAADLRSMPVRVALKDEIDAWPLDVDGDGDPGDLVNGRTSRFGRRKKILDISSPTIDGVSRIQRSYLEGDQSKLFVPCPHCHEMQTLEWERIHFDVDDDGRPANVFMACEHNGCKIEHHSIGGMLRGYEFRPTVVPKKPNKRSFHINGLYCPAGTVTWTDIVVEFLAAKHSLEKMKTWKNMRLAEVWKEQVNEVTAEDLRALAQDYRTGRVPAGGLVLVAAADTQDHYQDIDVYAVGRNEQMWHIENHKIHHEPGSVEWVREMDDYLLNKTFPHELGGSLKIDATNVDTGGHYTQEVYNYCRSRKHLKVYAIKGSSQSGKDVMAGTKLVDVNLRGRTIKSGLKLWHIGVHKAKTAVHHRMVSDDDSPGRIFFSRDLPLSFFEGLTAEKLNRRYVKGYAVYEWVNTPGARNEPFDNLGYVFHAVQRKGCHKWSESRWEKAEESVLATAQGDLFGGSGEMAAPPAAVDVVKPKGSGALAAPPSINVEVW